MALTRRASVAAAMIVRNERYFLPGCLESLRDRVDEIVVVDTGSNDETPAIAAAAGARVLHHAWCNDFSAARNLALEAVQSDWVLYIDADERLTLPSGGVVGDYFDPEAAAAFVRFRPKVGYSRYREWRLFRSDPRIRFAGRIHETVVPAIKRLCERDGRSVLQTRVEMDHLGYDGDQSHKHARNLDLLQKAVQAEPDRAYYWYHLAETLSAIRRSEEAIEAAYAGLASSERRPSEEQRSVASLIFQFLARTELEAGRNPLLMIRQAVGRCPEDHALRYLLARALLDAGRFVESLEIAIELSQVDPDMLGDGLLSFELAIFGDKAHELAALAYLGLGNRTAAAASFASASQLAPDESSYRVRAIALAGMGG